MARTGVLALVGSESLAGREIRDLLAGNSLGQNLKLIAALGEEPGKLTEQGGEPAILAPFEEASVEGADVILLAGSAESTEKARKLAPQAHLIDLTHALEETPHARLRAPMIEPAGYSVPAKSVQVIANGAAIALALVLARLHAVHKITRALAHIFEPASERGTGGVEELQQQTVGLLSFKGQPKAVFDAQLAFNMLARYGDEAPVTLEASELRIERHLASLLASAGHAPMPSLRLIQAPVFHGYGVSLWVEFAAHTSVAAIEQTLDDEPIDVRIAGMEPPNVVGMAGQSGLSVGGIAPDRNNPQAAWLWIVADNLRLQAENAVAVAQELL